jgi:uncharacterized protein YggE
MEHEVVVRGQAEVKAMPDRATVRVLVDGNGSTPDEAYAEAARAAAAVDEVLRAHADALARVMTAAMIVQPRTRWQNGEAVRTGWTASRTSVLEVRALERLSGLLGHLVTGGAAISSLAWELDAANEAHDQARGRAGEDARRRAERYATSLGIKLGGIAWVAEPGLRVGGNHFPPGGVALTAAPRAMAAASGPTIEVAPEEITLTASVEVGFAIATA